MRDLVNRIPDLIAAAPGFTTTEKMPTNAFRAKALEFYVKESELRVRPTSGGGGLLNCVRRPTCR